MGYTMRDRKFSSFLAILLPFGATFLQWHFGSFFTPYVWLLFYPAVFFSAWIGGFWCGLISTLISTSLSFYFFIDPIYTFKAENPKDYFATAVFLFMGILFSIALGELKKLNDLLSDELQQKDISHLRKTKSLEKRFQSIIEQSFDIISLYDKNFKVIYLSPSFERVTGFMRQERMGEEGLQFVHKDELEKSKILMQNILENPGIPITFQNRLLHKEGYFIWVEGVVTNLLHDPAIEAIVSNYREISKRKDMEDLQLGQAELLAKSIIFNASVIDSLAEHIAVINSRGVIIAVNAAWRRFAEENGASDTLQGYVGMNYLDVCVKSVDTPDGDAVNIGIRSVINGTLHEYRLEYPCNSVDEQRWFLMRATPMYGSEEGVVISHLNITERKKQEQEKEQLIRELSQNNRDLLQFSYIISHNLRAPISNLLGLLSLLEEVEIKDDFYTKIREEINHSIHTLNNTLNDLVKIIVIRKMTSIHQEKIILADLVESILAQIKYLLSECNPQIKVSFEKTPVIYFNKVYMESILLNLFMNAIKYREVSRNLEISIYTEDVEDMILLVFADNGIGIDVKRYQDRLFGFYQKFTDHPEGKGFGLYLIKTQVESLGGSISIESAVNVGTKFLIKIPRSKSE